MIVIGVDQSYTSTGFTTYDSINNIVIECGLIKSPIALDKFDRARYVADTLSVICKQYNPLLIGLEGLAFGMRGDATRDLAGLQWLIVDEFRRNKFEVMIISPKSVKKVATGSGKAKKEEMYAALPDSVKEKFIKSGAKKSTGLYDLTDSYFLAKIAATEVNNRAK